MKAKSLDDLECIATNALAASDSLPFDLYLYLESNHRIVHLIRKGDRLSKEMLEQYISRGVHRLYISKEDHTQYEELALSAGIQPEFVAKDDLKAAKEADKNSDSVDSVDPVDPSSQKERTTLKPGKSNSSQTAEKNAKRQPSTQAESGGMNSPEMPENFDTASEELFQDKAGTAMGGSPPEEARRILKEAFNSNEKTLNPEDVDSTRELIEEAVKVALPHLQEIVENVFGIHSHFIESAHGVRVSLYATLLCLAFDRSDLRSISTLAIAALFHDIGFAYESGEEHVKASTLILAQTVRHIPRNIIDIVKSHHELYDGSGYPDHLSAFEIHPMAQILLMADTLDEWITGKRDGKPMTFSQAFDAFANLEPDPSYPKLFHPEFYRRAVKYVRETDLTEAMAEAAAIVGQAAESLTQKSDEPGKDEPKKS